MMRSYNIGSLSLEYIYSVLSLFDRVLSRKCRTS